MAERHVRVGERHVADQRKIIAELCTDGHPTDLAEQLLTTFEESLEMHRQRLAQIMVERVATERGPG
jgi:hypothetical protein